MKLLNKILYIEFADFIAAGWKEDTIKKSNLRNGCNWMMVKDTDARKVLVEYDSLVDAHKEKLQNWLRKKNSCQHQDTKCECGNPYEYMAKEPIRQLVEKDFKAEAFYIGYKLDDARTLPTEYTTKYTTAASWLNMLLKFNADKKFIKSQLNLTLESFWQHVANIIESDGIDLPTSYKRLRMRMDEYKQAGYGCLVSGKFGNKQAAKINDEVSEAKLLEMLCHSNQYDDVIICYMYNDWAKNNGYKTIDAATVGNWRRAKECEIMISREGSNQFNEKYIRQVKGSGISKVYSLVESDDYNLNYYYQDPMALGTNKDMLRYVSYIVADSKFGLVLGKSYRQAKSPVFEMVKLAYIDAMYYVRKLTGGWYLPFELKADHWQKTNAFPFFESIANFVPPAHANKHRGFIEQLFGSPHAKRAEKFAAHAELNYNGNNLTAATRGVNLEVLKANDKSRPMVGDAAEMQVEKFFWLMQKMPAITRDNMEAPSKEQQWLDAWKELSEEDKRPISDEQFLMLFGIKHEPGGRRISITNRGIEPQIGNVQYSYDLPDYVNMMPHIGKQVNVIYDPYDMSRVLITDGEGLRFIAKTAQLQPRALHDATVGTRTALNMILAEKKEQVKTVGDKKTKRKQILIEESEYLEEDAMLGGFMQKELRNEIETQYEMVEMEAAPAAAVEIDKPFDFDFNDLNEMYLNR